MLDFSFDAGFDALLPGRAGERSRARRGSRTLNVLQVAGTVTFPGAMGTTGTLTNGYLTLRVGSMVFSQVSGSGMTHTEIDLADLRVPQLEP